MAPNPRLHVAACSRLDSSRSRSVVLLQPPTRSGGWSSGAIASSFANEREQVAVDQLRVRRKEAVRKAGIGFQRAVTHQLDCFAGGVLKRHDLVFLTVQKQDRNGDRFQILSEVGLGKGRDAVVVRLRTTSHSLTPPVIDQS